MHFHHHIHQSHDVAPDDRTRTRGGGGRRRSGRRPHQPVHLHAMLHHGGKRGGTRVLLRAMTAAYGRGHLEPGDLDRLRGRQRDLEERLADLTDLIAALEAKEAEASSATEAETETTEADTDPV